ncbi:DNA-binding protein [Aromatoleum evansii]|uniref:DNA-binding protein n=1 Tax=Aromatoleum evansii TaxID=59406 RepID=UPI00145CD87A|nr:DNA-binding protein [Aromatoleum evansii]NMG28345.1 hypothetical protein [Aromatoleum evansii]
MQESPPLDRRSSRRNEVFAACNRVCSRGKKPSLSEVRAEGVKGSDGDVHTFIKAWYEEVFSTYLGKRDALGMPSDVAELFSDVFARCRDLAAAQFDVERLRLARERDEANDLADALRERVAQLEEVLRVRDDERARLQLDLAEIRDQLAGAKTEIAEFKRLLRTREDEHQTALSNRDAEHARALERQQAAHQTALDEKSRTIERLDLERERMDAQYLAVQGEKAAAVEAQRKAQASAERAEQQRASAAVRINELEGQLQRANGECDRLRTEVVNLERRLTRDRSARDHDTPRFLRRIRGQS